MTLRPIPAAATIVALFVVGQACAGEPIVSEATVHPGDGTSPVDAPPSGPVASDTTLDVLMFAAQWVCALLGLLIVAVLLVAWLDERSEQHTSRWLWDHAHRNDGGGG